MKVTNEKIEDSQVFLSIEMEPAEVEESLEESYHRLVKKTDIPGFRRGKAPRAILERYLSRESLLEDALNNLLPKACKKAIEEQKLEAIASPSVEIAQTDPVIFKAIVPLRPTIKLGDYHQIQVTPEPVAVSEDDVSAIIDRLRHQHATWGPVERPVGFNDLVVLDIESSVEDKSFINTGLSLILSAWRILLSKLGLHFRVMICLHNVDGMPVQDATTPHIRVDPGPENWSPGQLE